MRFLDLNSSPAFQEQAAQLLKDGFEGTGTTSWSNSKAAAKEVEKACSAERIARVAVDETENVLGWIGAISQYSGNVWELHPLVVHPEFRRRGIGRALILDLEKQIANRGGYTLWLGTDDEDNRTSLGGVNLYPNVLEHFRNIRNLKNHPYEFYQKLGFALVGGMPDANGPGKPDIFMAKSVKG